MGSSNRHWPSMFKSKPCNTTHHQWHNDLISSSTQKPPYTLLSGGGTEERTPDPKPRWNPKPEQIRILEAIFNSGMVNPPRDEIRKIRAQLQEYGQVGDANVFYWFQNRKSRSKHKQRHIQNTKNQNKNPPSNSSSSSSDKSSLNSTEKPFSTGSTSAKNNNNNNNNTSNNNNNNSNVLDVSNSPTASVNQTFFQNQTDFLTEPFFFPVQQNQPAGGSGSSVVFTRGFSFPDVSGVSDVVDPTVGSCSSVLLSDLMLMNHAPNSKKSSDEDKIIYSHVTAAPTSTTNPIVHHMNQGGGVGPTKSTVYINDVCFEVSSTVAFNVREAFGEDAVLVHSSGQPVVTNEWGVTLEPLHNGAFYYLMRTFAPNATIDLI